MLFQYDTKNFPEGDKEWELPHMAKPQQSKIVKASASNHCTALGNMDQERKNLQSTKHMKSEVEV